MNKIKKIIFILILFIMVCVCSFSMIIESAGFYQGFSPENPLKGWLTAILPELVMLTLIVVQIPVYFKIPFKKIEFPLLHVISKILMLLIFTITIIAAAKNTLKPGFQQLSQMKTENKLVQVLEEQKRELKKDSQFFREMNQKANFAIASKAKYKNNEQLKEIYLNQNSDNLLMTNIDIVLIILLRSIIQTANLIFAYLIGYLYRLPANRTKSTVESELTNEKPNIFPFNRLKSTDEINETMKTYNNAIKGEHGRFESLKERMVNID